MEVHSQVWRVEKKVLLTRIKSTELCTRRDLMKQFLVQYRTT